MKKKTAPKKPVSKKSVKKVTAKKTVAKKISSAKSPKNSQFFMVLLAGFVIIVLFLLLI